MRAALRFKLTVTRVEVVDTTAPAGPQAAFIVTGTVGPADGVETPWSGPPMGSNQLTFQAAAADDFALNKSYWLTATPA